MECVVESEAVTQDDKENAVTEQVKLLLVDDEQLILQMLGRSLSNRGYHVETANSGVHALEVLSNQQVDIVITDINMPKMDGLELLKEIRNRYDDLPCMVVTGHGDVEYAVEALKLRAFNFITKPVDVTVLHHALQHEYESIEMRRKQELFLAQQKYTFDLINSANHSIKNQIGSTVAFIDNLKISQDNPEIMESLLSNHMLNSIKYGLNYISDFVKISLKNAGQGAVDKHSVFDPAEMMERSILLFRERKESKGIIISSNLEADLVQVQGAPIYFQSITDNLLQNACEEVNAQKEQDIFDIMNSDFEEDVDFDQLQKSFYIEIDLRKVDGYMLLRISNIGRTIEDKEAIFERGNTDKAEGSGIGLADARKMVEGYSGEIWAEDFYSTNDDGELGEAQGSSFILKIPAH